MGHCWNIIKTNGNLNIADFISEAMFSPLHGYYRTQKPIGKNGDFITSPEISQVFGELIAAYFLDFILASKEKIALVEMGAGRGTLLSDIITTIKHLTKKLGRSLDFEERVSFHIIEISESLTKIQQKKLHDCGFAVEWYQDFATFCQKNSAKQIYFLANELFDCFPTHQFIKTKAGWQEREVGILKDELVFVAQNFNVTKNKMVQSLVDQALQHGIYDDEKNSHTTTLAKSQEEGAIFEYSFAAINFMQDLCKALKIQGGIGIIIDYGYFVSPFKSTLQAVKNHQYHDVLQDVGNCDITTLVDFSALQNCAKKNMINSSLITQREFLLKLGIKQRQEALAKQDQAINRLIDLDKMGELFKCLIIWS